MTAMTAHVAPRSHLGKAAIGTAPDARGTRIVAVQGWTCDRTSGGMRGAALLARAAERRFGRPVDLVGEPLPPADLPWDRALARARPALDAAREAVEAALAAGSRPLNLLNKCGTSIASLPPIVRHHPDACLVWCDAHGDYNTPEITPTGYLGGLVIAALCGLWDSGYGNGLTPDRVIHVGGRDLDPAERDLMLAHGITLVEGRRDALDIDAVRRAVGDRPVVFHLDCDVIDPGYLPAEYRVADGLTPAAAKRLARALGEHHDIVAAEITEFEAPELEHMGQGAVDTILDIVEALGIIGR
ncbi:arginase family protein [Chelatococcus sp. SYSU_G07232]|uniref:Arginase family protein n=1 Tax=Chelatococcus albus TaxID=3047466 RepID=A0ABT7AEC2_9HYPH|nr:arginase family protein [Chelatococcus sp. SYSU_G07232]MDJ1157723.1 arginase family protein [Chelatococcus sp. SYSU_G07232]